MNMRAFPFFCFLHNASVNIHVQVYIHVWTCFHDFGIGCRPAVHEGSSYSTALSDSEVVSPVVFICHFFLANDAECFLYVLLATCMSSLEECLSYSLPVVELWYLSFCYWTVRILYIFWIQTPYQKLICKYFVPFCRLSFHFFDSVLWVTEVFNVVVVLSTFCLFLVLLMTSLWNHA